MATYVLIRGARRSSWYWPFSAGNRFFPADFQRRVVQDRLGLVADEMSGGHLPALAHPEELARHLERYRSEVLDEIG
jgi:hypothetical protein